MSGKKYPDEQRERVLQRAMDRPADYSTSYVSAKALGPKLGVGVEAHREWTCRPPSTGGEPTGDQ